VGALGGQRLGGGKLSVASLTILALLVTAASAAAPEKGAAYRGDTRNGDKVALKVGSAGKGVTFSLTCDSGGEAVKVRRMAVSASGRFSGSARQSGRVVLRVSGRFVSKRKVTGTKSGVVCFSGKKSFSATKE